MNCRVCSRNELTLIGRSVDDSANWYRCMACGCDSSDVQIELAYQAYQTQSYVDKHRVAGKEDPVSANVRWFEDYKPKVDGLDFLDVGHNDGQALMSMQTAGWRVHGFDVNPHANYGTHTTIAPIFTASLFPRQYNAVMCKDVIEHVDTWRMLLIELYKVVKRGGVLQLQTPRTSVCSDPVGYHLHHLQLFNVSTLELELRRVGFETLDRWLWGDASRPFGQAWMCGKR